MTDTAFARLMLTLLLILCAVLLYLDWMRQQEIEGLHMRIDGLSPARPLRTPAAATAEPAPQFPDADPLPGSVPLVDNPGGSVETREVHPLIRSVLAAHTDGELSTFGGQG